MNDIPLNYPQSISDEQSIGAWLRSLREAKNMTTADVASHLLLDKVKIEALEGDECDEGMQAYVKGYVRHYAKLFAVDPAIIDEKIAGMRDQTRVFMSPMRSSTLKGDRFKGLLTQYRLSILILIVAMVVVWIIAQAWGSIDDRQVAAQRIEAMVNINAVDPTLAEKSEQPILRPETKLQNGFDTEQMATHDKNDTDSIANKAFIKEKNVKHT